jgi:hypothetical protein
MFFANETNGNGGSGFRSYLDERDGFSYGAGARPGRACD